MKISKKYLNLGIKFIAMKRFDIYFQEELSRCILCNDAPCTRACKQLDCASIIRSARFENYYGAAAMIAEDFSCASCENQNCMKVCNRAKLDKAVDIPSIVNFLSDNYKKESLDASNLPSLEVEFCGIKCENPFVLASSVISSSYDMCARAFDAGWGGVSVKTINFLDIKEVSPRFDIHSPNQYPFIGFKNLEQLSQRSYKDDFKWMKRLRENYPTKLIISSIMGSNEKEWAMLSKMSQEAGADIIECNFSCPQMVGENLGSDVGQNSEMVKSFTKACVDAVTIPVIAKLTPNLAAPDGFVRAALDGGAMGIAGINTVKSITTVEFNSKENGIQGKSAVSGYSGRAVKPIALRFVRDTHLSIFKYNNDDSQFNISGIGGVENWRDAKDFILLGASTVQVCTAVMQYGYRIVEDLKQGLQIYMKRNNIESLKYLVARDLFNIREPEHLNRSMLSYPVFENDRCVSCGRCYIACQDAGHQAIELSAPGHKPVLKVENCVGCHLCRFVCIAGAIGHTEPMLPKKI